MFLFFFRQHIIANEPEKCKFAHMTVSSIFIYTETIIIGLSFLFV
jgi:hypothetical protein